MDFKQLSSNIVSLIILVVASISRLCSGGSIYLNGTGYLQDYDQLVVTERSLLWCISDSSSSIPLWILPNGTSTTTTCHQMSIIDGHLAVSLHVNSTESGVYTCQIEDEFIDGTITTKRVWIAPSQEPPSVEAIPLIRNYTCSLDALLVFSDTYAILLTATIHGGAPTNIDCYSTRNSHTHLTQVAYDRTIISTPNSISQVSIGYLVPFSLTSSGRLQSDSLKCIVTNRAGNDSFTCQLKESRLSSPVITNIEHTSTNTIIQWEPVKDPYNIFSHYTVYEYNDTEGITKRQHTHDTSTEVSLNSKRENLRIVANSRQQISGVILLPSIGIIQSTCQPSLGYDLLINVHVKNTDDSSIESLIHKKLSVLPANCRIIPPEILNIEYISRIRIKPKRLRTRRKKSGTKQKKTKKKSKKNSRTRSKSKKGGKTKKTKKTKTKTKGTKTKTKGTKTKASPSRKSQTAQALIRVYCHSCHLSWTNSNISFLRQLTKAKLNALRSTISEPSKADFIQDFSYFCNIKEVKSNTKACNCPTSCPEAKVFA